MSALISINCSRISYYRISNRGGVELNGLQVQGALALPLRDA